MANYSGFKKIGSESIIDNSVSSADIANSAVLSSNILDGSVTADKIVDASIDTDKLASTLDLSSKTVTYRPFVNSDFASGANISSSKLTGLGTLATLNSVTSSEIATGAISSAKLASGAQQSGYTYYGRMSNNSSITSGSTQYVQFDNYRNGNTNVFEPLSTGDYGVQIKKAGHIQWMYTQDIITSGSSGYFTIRNFINSTGYGHQLMRNTNGIWDCIFITGSAEVSANDVLKIRYESAPQSLDNGTWSQFAILWVGYE